MKKKLVLSLTIILLFLATIPVKPAFAQPNRPPVATDDAYSTDEDTLLSVAATGVLGNDTDPDGDSLTAVLHSGPSDGSLTLNSDGSFTYTPDPSFFGDDSFNYKVNDGLLDSNTARVTITVNSVNDPPTANDDTASTTEDTPVDIDVLANDSDVDGDSLSVSAVTPAGHGTVTNNGTDVTYSPDTNYSGPDSFTYTASDGNGGTDVGTVTIAVNAVNDAPVAVDDDYDVDEDAVLTIPAAGVHGTGLKAVWGAWQLTRGYFTARKIIQDFKPDALFFTGGYVAIPTGLAGRRIPTLLCLPDIEPVKLAMVAPHHRISAATATGGLRPARTFSSRRSR